MAPTTVPLPPLLATPSMADRFPGPARETRVPGFEPPASARDCGRTESGLFRDETRQEVWMARELAACPIIGVTGSCTP
jgi:hypothetical protein